VKRLGFMLLAAGFLAGAYVASLDPLTTDWRWFLPAIAVSFAGLLLHRRAERAESQASERVQANRAVLDDSLRRILEGLEDLREHKQSIPTYEMRFEIDRRFRDDLFAFVDARKSMIVLFGLQAYADVMSAFASGERYLNRVWSASTDGYVDEVLDTIELAHEQFSEARRLFDRYAEPASPAA
jgi:hypothetical protein